ncbi:hypothetical protein ACLOJK_023150 [Asimina triloba]
MQCPAKYVKLPKQAKLESKPSYTSLRTTNENPIGVEVDDLKNASTVDQEWTTKELTISLLRKLDKKHLTLTGNKRTSNYAEKVLKHSNA